MDSLQVVQWHLFAFKEISNLHYVLVERAAANVRVYAPNRVNEIFPSYDRTRIVMEIRQNSDFLTADGYDFSIGKC